jgi:hypothetical protein
VIEVQFIPTENPGRNLGIAAVRGGDELVLPNQKGVAKVVPDGHCKLIFLFAKLLAGGRKIFSDIPFFINLAKFVQFFINIFSNFLQNYIYFARRACR